MKKILLALLILCAGAVALARLNLLANQSRTAADQSRAESARLTREANELAAAAANLRAQADNKKSRLAELALSPGSSSATANAPGDPSRNSRSAKPSELLRRLGIGWNNSPNYILMSKAALKSMYLRGIESNGAFTPTACAILGLTSAERATVEAAMKRAEAQHADWAKTAVQRVEPAGEVVADYRLPANPELAHQIQEEGTALLGETLGRDRMVLIHDYARAWINEHEFLGESSVRLTVRRHTDGTQPPLWQMYEYGHGGGASGYLRSGDFPQFLRSLFPGGWPDLAQREGFALPDDYK
jgi:hypothetical protein